MAIVLIGLNNSGDVVFRRLDRLVQLQDPISNDTIGMCSQQEVFRGPSTGYWITSSVLSDPQDRPIWELAWAPRNLPRVCRCLLDYGKAGGSLVTEVGSFTLPDADKMGTLAVVCNKIIETFTRPTRRNDKFSELLERVPELVLLERCTDASVIKRVRDALQLILNPSN